VTVIEVLLSRLFVRYVVCLIHTLGSVRFVVRTEPVDDGSVELIASRQREELHSTEAFEELQEIVNTSYGNRFNVSYL
jgi:hypothetical protein